MHDIMISVIVLTYNQQAYISQAIDSILMQKTRFSYEILIGDDASTDRTGNIVRDYAQAYPQIIRPYIREQNLGASKNLFELLKCTRGKYIASCEGDDYWSDPSKLQKQVEFLEEHPEYSGCTHACQVVDEEGRPTANQRLPWVCLKEHYTLRDFRGIFLPGQAATLVHRNFFLDTEHDYSIIYQASPMIADRTVILILAASGPIRRLPEIMSCYRMPTGNSGQNATAKFFRDNADVNRMQYELTCRLEEYAKEEFGINIRFTSFKWEQWFKGWAKWFIGFLK